METVTLKNGAELLKSQVAVIMSSLRDLEGERPMAFYELLKKCHDQEHQPFGTTGEVLRNYEFIESDGILHSAVRDIVLSAVEGEGFDAKLGSPVATAV